MLSLLWLHPTSCRPCCQFLSPLTYPIVLPTGASRIGTGARLIPQDLPSSLFQPTSGSCRLYNGRRAASSQVPAALITPPPHEVILPDDLAISLLHQRFICIHLPDAYLPPQDGFSLTVHHHHLTVTAAQGGLTAPPVQRSRWIVS